jgi:hypothetical protein
LIWRELEELQAEEWVADQIPLPEDLRQQGRERLDPAMPPDREWVLELLGVEEELSLHERCPHKLLEKLSLGQWE